MICHMSHIMTYNNQVLTVKIDYFLIKNQFTYFLNKKNS